MVLEFGFWMDELTKEFIKRTLSKCPLNQMMPLLMAWGFVSDSQLETLIVRRKERLVLDILQFCEEVPATGNHAAALDMVYNHLHRNRRHWYVYQMSKAPDENDFFEVADFKQQFKRNLKSVANVTVHFKQFDDALWIRIAWGTHFRSPNQYSPTFVVYHSQTPYLFVSGLRSSWRPQLCQTLVIAAKYSQIQEMDLDSWCLDSLKQIVFQQYQAFDSYYPKPLQERNMVVVPEKADSRVTYVNKKEKERIQSWTMETFGDAPQPKLQFAQYKLETVFKCGADENLLSQSTNPFRCVVKFSSSHLLEAFKLLAPSGIAEAPLSQLLVCIPSKARNHFTIGEKRSLHSAATPGS
ncbi:centromere protein N [Ambystoma mexicanum]|uniref:centromere protein N n=1 Tax=Ambystoma mexicanum TaxID=8296 RepID=UPI0037E90297